MNNMETHGCELKKIDDSTYEYYFTSAYDHAAWVRIVLENCEWTYWRLGNYSKYEGSFKELQDCIDYAYYDMLRAKL